MGGWVGLVGGQGGCERRIEVFCENSKRKYFFLFGGGGGRGVGSGRGVGVGLGGGVRVDLENSPKKTGGGVNEELKFFCENSKKKYFFGGWGGSGGGGSGRGVGVGLGGPGGCERRIEVFWKIHKKNRGGGVGRGGVRWGVGLVEGSGWM